MNNKLTIVNSLILCFSNTLDNNRALIYQATNLGDSVAPELQSHTHFLHLQLFAGFNIIGCVNNGLALLELHINGFGLWIVLVVRNGEGAECAGVNKDLQSITSPYRYLS